MVQRLLYTTLFSIVLLTSIKAQTIWNGPKITFTKAAFADPALAASQDRITPSTWITRGNIRGIYNIVTETSYTNDVSPANTEWATGSLANYASLTYTSWEEWAASDPPSTVGKSAVVHLISDNIYIGITFLTWGQTGASGGTFSYERTTAPIVTPVKLTGFTATKKNNAVMLNWKTATEEKTASFTLERSAGGKKFTTVGEVPAAGSSTAEKQYSYTDHSPLPLNFYRLRTNDMDGAVSYSMVVVFKMEKIISFECYPNPASHFLRVQWNSTSHTTAQVIDVAGRLVKKFILPPGESSLTVDIATLKPGLYYLKVGAEQKPFIKE